MTGICNASTSKSPVVAEVATDHLDGFIPHNVFHTTIEYLILLIRSAINKINIFIYLVSMFRYLIKKDDILSRYFVSS